MLGRAQCVMHTMPHLPSLLLFLLLLHHHPQVRDGGAGPAGLLSELTASEKTVSLMKTVTVITILVTMAVSDRG